MALIGVQVADGELAARIGAVLAARGHATQRPAADRAAADDDPRPALMLVDATTLQAEAPVLEALRAWQQHGVPAVVLGDAVVPASRRLAARWGAARYLSLPVDDEALAGVVFALLDEAAHSKAAPPVRVLLGGAIGPATEQYIHALTQGGCSVHFEADAAGLLQSLQVHAVEVLVLLSDIEGASALELLQWLRQDPRFDDVMGLVWPQSKALAALPTGIDGLVQPLGAPALLQAVRDAALRRRRLTAAAGNVHHLLSIQAQTRRALDAHALVSVADERGCIVEANDHFCRTSGYARDELLGRNHRVVKSGRHGPERYADLWRTIAGGGIWQGELCNRRKDGSLYWVATTIVPLPAAHGRPRRYVSIRTDISAVKQVQEDLRHRVRQQQVLNGLAARLMRCNQEQLAGVVPVLLRLSAKLLGAERAQFYAPQAEGRALVPAARWPADSAHGGVPGDTLAALWSVWYESDVVNVADVAALTPGSALGLVAAELRGLRSLLLLPLRDGVGVQGFLSFETLARARSWSRRDEALAKAFAQLLSTALARANAEAAQVRARDEADRANRAKSDFLATMSHELRTPMNAILGFGQLLELDQQPASRQADYVQELLAAGRHLLALIDDVLNLAHIDSGRLELSTERIALDELLDDCLRLLRPLAQRRRIDIHLRLSHGLALKADRVRLRQVLINLLSNAIKYNVEGGRIDIEADRVPAGPARLLVRDTGPGIPAERQHELFQPFNRLGAEGGPVEGTGIGLVIVRRLVELMHGTVGVDSSPGCGSLFWVELPAFEGGDEAMARPASDSRFAALPELAGKRVLYIDDNPSNLRLVSRIMARWPSVQLLTAQEPRLGIELAAAHRPDVVLLDIQMSPIDGYEVLSRLRALGGMSGLPVIAITANAMPRDLARARAAGFDEVLTKPFDVRRFIATLERLLDRSPGGTAPIP